MEVSDEFQHAALPQSFKGLRACLRCSLIKEFVQFYESGCENCGFLNMEGNNEKVHECTTPYFEGTIALLEPSSSWVGRWQRLGNFEPGVYAIEVTGELPKDVLDLCDDMGYETRENAKSGK